jgi:uncharacterized glyoxalase superfamily protein PhnB
MVISVALAAMLGLGAPPSVGQQDVGEQMKRMTPIITVEEIEPCLGFWIETLGFEQTMEVPEGDRLGFVALQGGSFELMYQTRSSIAADLPDLAASLAPGAMLFIEVADLDALKPKLEGVEIVVPERTTFYGSREIWLRAPCGTIVGLAEFAEQQQAQE